MQTKRDKARELIKAGKTKEAIKIVRKFDLIYTKEEIRILDIAYECFSGKESFYNSLGENTNQIKIEAEKLLNKMFS